jgi:hypothetical protein
MFFKRLFLKIFLLAIAAVFLGVFLPGWLMYLNHSYSNEDIIERLDAVKKAKYAQNLSLEEAIQRRLSKNRSRIVDSSLTLSNADMKTIYLAPYYPNNQLLILFPLCYFHKTKDLTNRDAIVDYLSKNDPISVQNQSITAIAGAVAFLLPIVRNFV